MNRASRTPCTHRRAAAPLRASIRPIAALLLVLAVSACDETFTPIQPSKLHFSVFGYLDASADTQWIRVMPVRPLQVTSPEPLAARVTLERLGTGQVVELRDSVFRFTRNPDVGSEGIYAHNFWTAQPIEPGARYRFTAILDGETPSEATVEIAPWYDVEVWISQSGNRSTGRLWLDGLNHAAFSRITHFYDDCGSAVEEELLVAHSNDSDGALQIPIHNQLRPREGCGLAQVEKRELLIVGSGAAWPSGTAYLAGALGVLDAPSDITNSIGFLGGILTRRVPYEDCDIVNGPPDPEPYCRLRYDDASATLRGSVRDLTCGGEVARATVRLREVPADPELGWKVRSTTSGHSGSFEIGALVGGQRYILEVYRMAAGLYEYEPYADTLTFAAGEQRIVDVGLRSLNPCRP